MKLLACIGIGITVTLLLFGHMASADIDAFSDKTNNTSEFEFSNLSPATNTLQESTTLAEEPIPGFPENENFFSGNGDDTFTLPVIDAALPDLQVTETTRVSVRTNGKQGDNDSYSPSVSSDGRYVAFYSHSANLVNGDTNGVCDIFVHDRQTGETRRISLRTNGKQGNSMSYYPSISSDGRYVTFASHATNLVNGDTNGACDIFVHDRQTGETRRVSVRTNGKQGDSSSLYPSISSDGRYIVFESEATNLVNGDTNGSKDVFVHDRQTGETRRISVRTNGKQGDGGSYSPSVSTTGRYVTFHSSATNLVIGDTNGAGDVFVRDRQTGETRRISVRTNGKQGDAGSYNPSISSAGRYVAFESYAANLVNGDTNGVEDIFVHDQQTGETRRVSVRTNGAQGDSNSYNPSISSDGRHIAFESEATNLVNGDTNGEWDIFVHDRQTGETRRVSVRTNGAQGDGSSFSSSISSEGSFISFWSFATNLVNGDTNGAGDIFVTEFIT